jgi:hypothetical protein
MQHDRFGSFFSIFLSPIFLSPIYSISPIYIFANSPSIA